MREIPRRHSVIFVHEPQLTQKQKFLRILAVTEKIPAGCVASYSLVAQVAGLPGRARLVGKALGSTLASVSIPWHRVLRADGKIAFALDSERAHEQTRRLMAEGIPVKNGKVNIRQYLWDPHSLMN